MSVLIKGMEMPTHCTECDFWHDGVFEHCLLNMEIQNEDVPLDEGEYPNACPLVPVPPHGRLIDADKAAKQGWTISRTYSASLTEMVYEVKKMTDEVLPTVIEAEENK